MKVWTWIQTLKGRSDSNKKGSQMTSTSVSLLQNNYTITLHGPYMRTYANQMIYEKELVIVEIWSCPLWSGTWSRTVIKILGPCTSNQIQARNVSFHISTVGSLLLYCRLLNQYRQKGLELLMTFPSPTLLSVCLNALNQPFKYLLLEPGGTLAP